MAKRMWKTPRGVRRAAVIERIDAVLGAAAARCRRSSMMHTAKQFATIADQPPLIALSITTIVAGALLRHGRLERAGVRMLASEMAATGAKALIKRYVARTRPGKMLKDGRYARSIDPEAAKNEGPWNSFPSGHTAGAVAVGRAFVREFPGAAPIVAAGATAVAVVQPFTGAHFPSDVVAGGLVGLASEALIDAAARRLGT
jgi:membrane-associated phospholipid phosphatase